MTSRRPRGEQFAFRHMVGNEGNPVVIGRRFFAEIHDIEGDVGARHLIGAYPELVHEVEMEGDAILLDIDTPEALARLTG